MTQHDVEEEGFGWHQHRPHREEALQQLRLFQERVGPFRGELPLDGGPPVGGAAAQQQDHQFDIRRPQAAAKISANHESVSS